MISGSHEKVIHIYSNLFKYIWFFSGYQLLTKKSFKIFYLALPIKGSVFSFSNSFAVSISSKSFTLCYWTSCFISFVKYFNLNMSKLSLENNKEKKRVTTLESWFNKFFYSRNLEAFALPKHSAFNYFQLLYAQAIF